MSPRVKQFMVEAPFTQRIIAGAVSGLVLAALLSLVLVLPQLKIKSEASVQEDAVRAQVEVLEAQEAQVKTLVESIVQEINSAQLSVSSSVRKPEEVSALMENLGIAITKSGMTMAGQLELGMVEVESANGTDKVFQPINVNLRGNMQNTIWFFKMAAEAKALAKIKSFRLQTDPNSYPDLSASLTLRVQTEEKPTPAAVPQ